MAYRTIHVHQEQQGEHGEAADRVMACFPFEFDWVAVVVTPPPRNSA